MKIILLGTAFLLCAVCVAIVIGIRINGQPQSKPTDYGPYIACTDRFLAQSKAVSKLEARFDSLHEVWKIAYRAEAWKDCRAITKLMEKLQAEKQIQLDRLIRISDTCKNLP